MPSSQFAIVPAYMVSAAHADLKVYMVLALHVDYDTGVCWPSRQTIATEAGVSLSTVKRSLARLAALGAIEVEHRRTDHGDSTSNLYRLPYAINRRGGVTGDPTPGRGRTHGGVAGEPQTRTNYQEDGRTPDSDKKLDPAACAHRPMDSDGYCTACGTHADERVSA